MRVFIDGDGCPVVSQAVAISKKYNLPCTVLCDTSHVINSDYAETVIVSKGADSVDFALVGMISKGDVAVTQDHGLAAMCLSKRAYVLNQNGTVYTQDNIDGMLFSRYVTKKIKNAGGRVRGPSKREKSQDEAFCNAFEEIIKAAL